MPASTTTPNASRQRDFHPTTHPTARELAVLTERYPGRVLFSTGFTPAEQVVAHLIFKHQLQIRVYTSSGNGRGDILFRSVDFFNGVIEVYFQQGQVAAGEWAGRHPELAEAAATNPAAAPLGLVLRGRHLLVTGLRRQDLLAAGVPAPVPFEWDQARQRAVFHPLFNWSDEAVEDYVRRHALPCLPAPVPAAPIPAAAADTPLWGRVAGFFRGKSAVALRSLRPHTATGAPLLVERGAVQFAGLLE